MVTDQAATEEFGVLKGEPSSINKYARDVDFSSRKLSLSEVYPSSLKGQSLQTYLAAEKLSP
ncbi:hypothetical protein GAR06_06255 [Micromonospora saelicesensis]|nr:hypothetical protein GAR06_06255 [Micromonospora saelicesensis]